MKPLPGHILDKVNNMSPLESAELVSYLRPIAPHNDPSEPARANCPHNVQGDDDRDSCSSISYSPVTDGVHRNQPNNIYCSLRFFQKVIAIYALDQRKARVPRGPNPFGHPKRECLNFALRSRCQRLNCVQRCNHVPISSGSTRHRALLNLIDTCLQLYRRDGGQEF